VDYWFFGQPEFIDNYVKSLSKAGLDIPPRTADDALEAD
jgi:hypothetical protein